MATFKRSEAVALLGATLLRCDGTEVPTADALPASIKSIAFYFSAHWCPPCRGFTPVLAAAYNAYAAKCSDDKPKETEVVFISGDHDADQFKNYHGEMPWLAVPFSDDARRTELREKFGVQGIPSLKVAADDVSKELADARGIVQKHGDNCFPLTTTHLAELETALSEARERVLAQWADKSIFSSLKSKAVLEGAVDSGRPLALMFTDGDFGDATYEAAAKSLRGAEADPAPMLVYVPWMLYNEDSNHEATAAKFSPDVVIDEEDVAPMTPFRKQLQDLGDVQQAPHLCLFLPPADNSGKWKLACSDQGMRQVCQLGSSAYPWSKEKIAEIEAQAQVRRDALKAREAGLKFFKERGESSKLLNNADGVEASEALADVEMVGVYFSAHWCGPCRGFTPLLCKAYNEINQAKKRLEIVFVSSDRDESSFADYFKEMPWLALPFEERQLKTDLSELYGIRGIPTLLLFSPDGKLVTEDGRQMVDLGAEFFPWGSEEVARGKKAREERKAAEMAATIANETTVYKQQAAAGVPVLKRIRGDPDDMVMSFDSNSRSCTVSFSSFSTVGTPDTITKSGVLYFEATITEAEGIPQVGFATASFQTGSGCSPGEGVGDDDESWGLDGTRKMKWFNGCKAWPCSWAKDDVVGFAANVDLGKIAVSKNGSWTEEASGVVFQHEAIKGGVYPALTAGGYGMKINLAGFKYPSPPEFVWSKDAE